MAAALAAAAALGTLPPSAALQAGPVGIHVSGADFATTVRARLETASDQPGPNRFTLSIVDYDSRKPVSAGRVSLRFTPIDDPGVAPTLLQLTRGQDGAFGGAGANMAFDGRWQVTALIERAGDSVEVPLELEARPVWRPYVFVARVPGASHDLYGRRVRRDAAVCGRAGTPRAEHAVRDVLRPDRGSSCHRGDGRDVCHPRSGTTATCAVAQSRQVRRSDRTPGWSKPGCRDRSNGRRHPPSCSGSHRRSPLTSPFTSPRPKRAHRFKLFS